MDPIKPMRVVCAHETYADPALDMEKEELAAYRESGDAKLLRFRDGMKPTWFTLHQIEGTCLTVYVQSCGAALESMMRAFLASCRRIELPDGKIMEPNDKKMAPMQGQRVASADWWNTAVKQVGVWRLYAIGALATTISELPESERPFI